jgi:formylglycine-generating enzyme required for sulfatase activity
VARGGAWDSPDPISIADRIPLLPDTARPNLGFRCVEE